jgi:hypothetical protein
MAKRQHFRKSAAVEGSVPSAATARLELLIPLVRLLARQAARECFHPPNLNEVPHDDETE